MYIVLVTVSFDSSYFAVKCNTEKEAIDKLNEYIEEEIKTVKEERNYTPIVRNFGDTLKELVYEEHEFLVDSSSDVAEYRVIEVK